MKQEAINTFTDGLVKDLHPLNTPNNVLTDALNATLITYDGNEYILQNDVGNGRVETARLPSGYVPVGMKEYGGIIYVASYNPLTGRSQLGSFPSPERQISTEELGRTFQINANINTNNAYIRLDILDENKADLYKLNPGDKFLIASAGISTYFSGIYEGIIKVHIGIVDKENNITYIEDDLESPYIIDTSDIETNTNFQVFTSKTSGYLSIIIELLTIDTFSVSKDIKLLSVGSAESPQNSNPEFALTFEGGYTTSSKINVEQFKLECNLSNTPIYSTSPDLKIGLEDLRKNDVLDYTITPICKYGEIGSFKVSGKVDFGILGTGYANLSEWRYYSDNDYLKINWGLDYDPIKFMKVESVKFKFHDFTDNLNLVKFESSDPLSTVSYYKCGAKDSYNGNFSEKIPYINGKTRYGLKKGNLYFVAITIDFINQSGNVIPSKEYYRLVYTTGVFNEQFIKYEATDFKKLNPSITYSFETESKVDSTTITPQSKPSTEDVLSQSNSGDGTVFLGASALYNVSGKMSVVPKIKNENTLFGRVHYKTFLGTAPADDKKNVGIVIEMGNTVADWSVVDTPTYLGTSTENQKALEDKLKAKYDNKEPYRGRLNADKTTVTEKDGYTFTLNGEIRRGIISSGVKPVEISVKRWILTPAVESRDALNDWTSADLEKAQKTEGPVHSQIVRNVVMTDGGDDVFRIGLLAGSGKMADRGEELPDKLDSAFDSSKINSYNSNNLKRPIGVLVPGVGDEDILLPKSSLGEYSPISDPKIYPGRWNDVANQFGWIHSCMILAWKNNDYSYVLLNCGGLMSDVDQQEGTPDGHNHLTDLDGCTHDYPVYIKNSLGNTVRKTLMDMVYDYLSRVYVAQKRARTVSYNIPSAESITYHDTFDETFTVTINNTTTVNNDYIIQFETGSADLKTLHLNKTDVGKYFDNRLKTLYPELQPSDYEQNVTLKSNSSGGGTYPAKIEYSVGRQFNLTDWYTVFVTASKDTGTEDPNAVYDPNGIVTKDLNGKAFNTDTVYRQDNSGNGFIPYDGKVYYPEVGASSNTHAGFLKIKRVSQDTDAILYVNPLQTQDFYNLRKQRLIGKMDRVDIIYPNGNPYKTSGG